jgi:hypothetical protein
VHFRRKPVLADVMLLVAKFTTPSNATSSQSPARQIGPRVLVFGRGGPQR